VDGIGWHRSHFCLQRCERCHRTPSLQ
jgi:hypothetical protein